jgi:cytoskeleton protein RodZ
MTGQTGGEAGREPGIGRRLRSARERSGLTVEQAALKLHLDPAVLRGLEAEDFGSLGAPIYVKGYLGRYAELVGESAESLQHMLSNAVIPAPDLTRIPRARVQGSRLIGPAAIAVITALVVVSSLWWGLSRWHMRQPLLLQPRIVPGNPGPHGSLSSAPAVLGKPAGRTGAPVHAAAVARAGASAGAGAHPAGLAAAGPSTGEVRIELKFSAPSWLDVKDASGKLLFRAIAPAGSVRVFEGPAPLYVVLGYAPAVTLVANGRATPIGALEQADHAASFEVAADGRVLSGQSPGGE